MAYKNKGKLPSGRSKASIEEKKRKTAYGEWVNELLKKERADSNLKGSDVAKMLGITQPAYSSIEAGKSPASIFLLQKILSILGIEVIIQLRKQGEVVSEFSCKK